MDENGAKKKEAVGALIKIALWEGAFLLGIVGLFVATNSIPLLVGGLVVTTLTFGPMFWRWYKAHGAALRESRTIGDAP